MPTYKIEIEYRTGSSFHTEDTTDSLDGSWTDITIVEENMKRINLHYDWYEEVNTRSWRKPKKEEIEVPYCVKIHKDYGYTYGSVLLLTDDKVEYEVNPFWCGYFESLYSVSCKIENMRIDRR